MKKIAALTMAVIMLTSLFAVNASAQENISVYINGKKIEFDVPPQAIEGRTMVPLRGICEALGMHVNFDNKTKQITISNNTTIFNSTFQMVNILGNKGFGIVENNAFRSVESDVPTMAINGRTLVPVRIISESLGCNVEWKQETQSVLINTYTTSAIPTYTRYSTVPDWGAITGDVLIQEQEIEGAYAYFYQAIDKYKSYECYIEKLERLGYHLMEAPITTDEYIWYVFEHEDNSLPYVGIYFENNTSSNVVGIAIPNYNGIGNTNGTITTYDIKNYLEKNYNTIDINGTEYKVSFIVLSNPFDVEGLNYDFEIEPSIQGFSINDNLISERKSDLSMSEKKQVVEDIKGFIQSYAKDIIKKFPEHRIQGQISYGHYKYPNLKLDWVGGSFFNWSNYDTKDFKSSEPSDFRWKTSYDTYKFDFNEYFVDLETNIPVTVEDNRDTIMIYEIKDISYDPTQSKEDDEAIMVDFTLYAGGSGYVYFNMYDENDNFLYAEIEFIDAGENEYRQLWHKKTKKIIIADDEDKDGVKKNKEDFDAEVPVTLVGEYSFEGELTIEECILADRYIDKMDLPIMGEILIDTTYDLLISASGDSAYIYLNFFDDKGRYIDSYYEYIYAKEDRHYYLHGLPENTHSVKFSREKIYK